MNDAGITYPVPTGIAEWSVWDASLAQVVARNRIWPVKDGGPIEGQEARIWWLRQVVDPQPEFNANTQRLETIPDIVDLDANTLTTGWTIVDLPASDARANLSARLRDQIRLFSDVDKIEDETRGHQTALDHARWTSAIEIIEAMPDDDLESASDVLTDYAIPDAAYAANLVRQEANLLARDDNLRSAGDEGLYSTDEYAAAQARVAANSLVARGQSTGVQEPQIGAPRGFVTLDGEAAVMARFVEISFDWSAQTYFIPRVVLDDMPNGVMTAQVYAMIYDEANVYRSWMPFAQRPDGKWQTPSDVNYIGIAQTASSTWRVAIAYQGTSEDYEITQRVILVPPDGRVSPVRWGSARMPGA